MAVFASSRRAAIAVPLALALPLASAGADERWMTDGELEAAFADAALEGKYADGRPFHERYRADRRVEYRERGVVTGGRWSVQAGTFCTIYDADASGGCFRVKQVSANCYEFYFVARSELEAERDPRRPAWTARGAIVGKPGACEEESTV